MVKFIGAVYANDGSLESEKVKKNLEANEAYRAKIVEGYNYKIPWQVNTYTYQLDLDSQKTYNNFATGRNRGRVNPHRGYVRSIDNVNVPMNDLDLDEFITAMGSYISALRPNLHRLKDEVTAATTIDDVRAIDVHEMDINGTGNGWPLQDY